MPAWVEVREAFLELLSLPESARRGRVAEWAEVQPDLAEELLSLLAHDSAAEGRLGALAGDLDDSVQDLGSAGPYDLLEERARNREGDLFLARRTGQPSAPRVLLQRCHIDPLDPERLERLRSEQERLGSDPDAAPASLARALDAGMTQDGRHYFVMEFVEGLPLVDFCNRQRMPLSGRIELLLEVCDALEFAHARFVPHGRLESASVVVAETGECKVVGPGVLRGLAQAVALRGARRVREGGAGEPASAEVAGGGGSAFPREPMRQTLEPSASAVATADVQAVGRLLAQLVVGESVSGWQRELARDLDAVVLAALGPEPPAASGAVSGEASGAAATYPSIESLGRDLGRLLDGRPVAVRDTGRARRLSRWGSRACARHPIAVCAGLAALLALGFGVAAMLREARGLRSDRDQARSQQRVAEARSSAAQRRLQRGEAERAMLEARLRELRDAAPTEAPRTGDEGPAPGSRTDERPVAAESGRASHGAWLGAWIADLQREFAGDGARSIGGHSGGSGRGPEAVVRLGLAHLERLESEGANPAELALAYGALAELQWEVAETADFAETSEAPGTGADVEARGDRPIETPHPGRFSAALASAHRAVESARSAQAGDPAGEETRWRLATSLALLARMDAALGREVAALAGFREAIDAAQGDANGAGLELVARCKRAEVELLLERLTPDAARVRLTECEGLLARAVRAREARGEEARELEWQLAWARIQGQALDLRVRPRGGPDSEALAIVAAADSPENSDSPGISDSSETPGPWVAWAEWIERRAAAQRGGPGAREGGRGLRRLRAAAVRGVWSAPARFLEDGAAAELAEVWQAANRAELERTLATSPGARGLLLELARHHRDAVDLEQRHGEWAASLGSAVAALDAVERVLARDRQDLAARGVRAEVLRRMGRGQRELGLQSEARERLLEARALVEGLAGLADGPLDAGLEGARICAELGRASRAEAQRSDVRASEARRLWTDAIGWFRRGVDEAERFGAGAQGGQALDLEALRAELAACQDSFAGWGGPDAR